MDLCPRQGFLQGNETPDPRPAAAYRKTSAAESWAAMESLATAARAWTRSSWPRENLRSARAELAGLQVATGAGYAHRLRALAGSRADLAAPPGRAREADRAPAPQLQPLRAPR